MGIFKTRKNKKFSYSPRYWDNDGEGSPYEIRQRFDSYRSTVGSNKNLKEKMTTAWDDLKQNSDPKVNKRILYIFLILLFIFLYLINFDISIFFKRS